MNKLFNILKSPNVVAAVVYAVVALFGIDGVIRLIEPDTSEVTPIEVMLSFEEELKVMQAEIDKLMKIYELKGDDPNTN